MNKNSAKDKENQYQQKRNDDDDDDPAFMKLHELDCDFLFVQFLAFRFSFRSFLVALLIIIIIIQPL